MGNSRTVQIRGEKGNRMEAEYNGQAIIIQWVMSTIFIPMTDHAILYELLGNSDVLA